MWSGFIGLCKIIWLTPPEQKTKPTQHSVKELRAIGISPDIIIG
ncbi:MAG: hypothetical protein QXL25_00565, partial [Candidatus Bathyarchaeia archaeon]